MKREKAVRNEMQALSLFVMKRGGLTPDSLTNYIARLIPSNIISCLILSNIN